ncbi:glycosyltransferase family 4 protein [Patescibacteria group bacterium]|nr:glycosyltransferase family 4 protein [Patescibacteria group bacterium]MBU1673248.1 glycosyltransferase family 4 protein [Patescibacteria group bacterium]MBU1963509.1 glycosyltransferase family 4 protein [Patescibacteria group bacterium]
MNILVIAPTPFFADRGCHIRIYEEAKAMKKAGHNPVIFTYHNGRDVGDLDIRRIMDVPWYKKESAGASWHKIYLDILLLGRVLAGSYGKKYDYIHAHLHEGCWIAWWINLFHFGRLPIIFDAQGSLVSEMWAHNFIKSNFLKNLFTFMENFINALPNFIVASSPAFKAKREVIVVEDGVDTDFFKVDVKKEANTLIYAGGLSDHKGINMLLDAMNKLPEYKLKIIGYPVMEKYKAKAGDNVEFIGRVDYFKMPEYLARAQVGVDPKPTGTEEASGKIINYMAAGLPVVCFDTPNNKNLLGENGFYAKENDVDDFARQIKLAMEADYNGEAEKKIIHDKFNWDKNIWKILKLVS